MKKVLIIISGLMLSLSLVFGGINTNVQDKNEKAVYQTVLATKVVPKKAVVKKVVAKAPRLSSKYNEWYNMRNSKHTTPGIPSNIKSLLGKYNIIYKGNTSKKVFYFTFDAGGDTGYATKILDVLKKQGIKATFFVTKSYITKNPQIIKRMVKEGHVVANHTIRHIALPKLTDTQISQELSGVESEFKRVTGSKMVKCMRPPMGAYSEKSLYRTKQLGYKTVFWSIAYRDYDVKKQPTRNEAMTIVKNNYHNGAIMLLHVGSKTNGDTLNEMIVFLKSKGYSFGVI